MVKSWGDQWIKNDLSYVKFNKKSTVDSSIIGKRVVSKVNNLRFYDAPSWQDKDVAGSVDVGLGFTIDGKVSVNGSPQYKVHNSKDKTYYVTANEAYVVTLPIKLPLKEAYPCRECCWFVIKFDQKHATQIDFSTEETQTF